LLYFTVYLLEKVIKGGETIAPVKKNTTYYYSYMPHIIDQILAKIFGAYHGLVNNV